VEEGLTVAARDVDLGLREAVRAAFGPKPLAPSIWIDENRVPSATNAVRASHGISSLDYILRRPDA
jgi:hypothetical protein